MTRVDFFTQLQDGLKKLPPEEMENALRYYSEYFDDAGPEEEQRILRELGDPLKVAQQIVAESMVRDIIVAPPHPQVEKEAQKKPRKGLSAVWIVLLAVFASPIALPIAMAIALLILALVLIAAALVFTLFVCSISFMVGGLFGFFVGCVTLFVHLPTGLCSIGTGIALAGVGLLLLPPSIWMARTIFTGIARLIGHCIVKKGGVSK